MKSTIDRVRRVLITGATSGIGRAAADRFAREGYEVAILAEDPEQVEKTVCEIRAAGGNAIGVCADLSKPEQVQGLIGRLEESGFRLDILVNNAGIGLQADILETRDSDLRLLFEVNFFAMMTLSRDALRSMATRRRGHIINVSSAAARRALPGMSTYACTKAAMHVFSQALRVEGKGCGVSVTELLPMSVRTPFFQNAKNRSGKSYAAPSFSVTPEVIAAQIWRAVRRPVPEIYTSQLARLVLALDGINPRWLESILFRRRRKEALQEG
jgi:short-subunit dehydrogenase